MKKSKPYIGDIPFNWGGDLVQYAYSSTSQIQASDFINGVLHFKEWDGVAKAWVHKPSIYTLDELQFRTLDTPLVRGRETYIGEAKAHVWKPNYEFQDTLKFCSYHKGRSSVGFNLKSTKDGREYAFFMTHFEELIPYMNGGFVTGDFTFCKRGSNYGTKLA